MNDNGVVWEDPPKIVHRTTAHWLDTLTPLMERPGAWARVREMSTSGSARTTAGHLRSGRVQRPPGRWEFTSRTRAVYARYVGPEDGAP